LSALLVHALYTGVGRVSFAVCFQYVMAKCLSMVHYERSVQFVLICAARNAPLAGVST